MTSTKTAILPHAAKPNVTVFIASGMREEYLDRRADKSDDMGLEMAWQTVAALLNCEAIMKNHTLMLLLGDAKYDLLIGDVSDKSDRGHAASFTARSYPITESVYAYP